MNMFRHYLRLRTPIHTYHTLSHSHALLCLASSCHATTCYVILVACHAFSEEKVRAKGGHMQCHAMPFFEEKVTAKGGHIQCHAMPFFEEKVTAKGGHMQCHAMPFFRKR
jgi:hypothetical protein